VNNFIEQKEEWSEIESKTKGAVNFFLPQSEIRFSSAERFLC
jgi:hypothetical protein